VRGSGTESVADIGGRARRACASAANTGTKDHALTPRGPALLPLSPLPFSPQDFYKSLQEAIRTGVYATKSPSAGDRFVMKVATVYDAKSGGNRLAGVIALTTMKLPKSTPATAAAQRGAGAAAPARSVNDLPPSYDLLSTVETDALRGAYILMLAVAPKYRRNHIGTDLLQSGVRAVVSTAEAGMQGNINTRVVFVHVPRGSESAENFYDTSDFSRLGYVPKFWAASGTDAVVWAKAFHESELATFVVKEGQELADLSDRNLKRLTPRCPKWAMTLACQFGLPLGIVGVLFIISYALVLLGPLRGISSKYMERAGEGSVNVDEYVDEDGADL
jgi:ribosomal protein S18 acetylase RimI-like enzyme